MGRPVSLVQGETLHYFPLPWSDVSSPDCGRIIGSTVRPVRGPHELSVHVYAYTSLRWIINSIRRIAFPSAIQNALKMLFYCVTSTRPSSF